MCCVAYDIDTGHYVSYRMHVCCVSNAQYTLATKSDSTRSTLSAVSVYWA